MTFSVSSTATRSSSAPIEIHTGLPFGKVAERAEHRNLFRKLWRWRCQDGRDAAIVSPSGRRVSRTLSRWGTQAIHPVADNEEQRAAGRSPHPPFDVRKPLRTKVLC
jgi:hypothetical protein